MMKSGQIKDHVITIILCTMLWFEYIFFYFADLNSSTNITHPIYIDMYYKILLLSHKCHFSFLTLIVI